MEARMNPFSLAMLLATVLLPAVVLFQHVSGAGGQAAATTIPLPLPQLDGRCSVEKALATRRSLRGFKDESLSLAALSQLVWAAQGITEKMDAPPGWSWGTWQGGKRTAPSAGALYPLEVYVVASKIDGLKPAVYHYQVLTHELQMVVPEDKRSALASAAFEQKWLEQAPCLFVVGAVYARTAAKYGERAQRYVHIEVGHAVENICLQAVALKLGATMVGAFKDEEVKKVLELTDEVQPLAIVPVGRGTEDR
jgi:SagB-type dehydrogenase family enzyme